MMSPSAFSHILKMLAQLAVGVMLYNVLKVGRWSSSLK